jgi:PKD repeat protein
MSLRFRKTARHNLGGRRVAYLAAACAVAAVLFPAAAMARANVPQSFAGLPLLQANPAFDPYARVNDWSYGLSASFSNTFLVNTTADALPSQSECLGVAGDCSLRQAIDKANAESSDEIDVPAGTYSVTLGTLPINGSMTIVGAGTGQTIIDGSGNVDANTHQLSRIMKVASGQSVGLDNLSLTGGVDGNDENATGGATETVSLNGGGAIFNDGGTLSLANVVFQNNAASNPIGGAVATAGGSLGMAFVTFDGNAAGVGGALRIRSGEVSGISVTFTDNDGEFGGGSIYMDSGFLSLTNSTIDHSEGLNGFGIGIQNAGGQVNLLHVTIAHSEGYALLTDVGASTGIANTIIGLGGRGDCVPAGRTDSVTNATTAAGVTGTGNNSNLDQNGDCSVTGSNNLTGDPLLSSPGFFGGPTDLTKTDALKTGSPAIGAVPSGCLSVDQRGESRSTPCSIGAFEYIAGAHASFTYDPPNPLDQQTVTFTNMSTTTNDGATLSYVWNFGDGQTSTDANPTHAFAASNTGSVYAVTLQVTDSTGSADETTQDVTVEPNHPIASFNFGAAAPNTPVQFDASGSTDPAGTIVDYHWSWGDDSNDTDTGSSPTATHTFASAGTYPVTLTVTDDGGRTDSISQDVSVQTPSISNYYVDATWTDRSNGDTVTGPDGQQLTIGIDAFATIADALAAANEGQPNAAVRVAAGDYEELPLTMTQPGLELIGAPNFGTHVHLLQLSVDGPDEVVSGLDLIGPGHDGGEGTGCQGCGTSPVVSLGGDVSSDGDDIQQDAVIVNNRISFGFIGIAFTSGNGNNFPASGSEAIDNEIFGNVTGVSVDGGLNNLIEDNDIHDNGSVNQAGSQQPQAGVLITDDGDNQPTGGNLILANTIARSVGNGISIRTSDNIVDHNTLSDNGSYPFVKEASGVELVAGSNDAVNGNAVTDNTITGSAFAGIKIGDGTDSNRIAGNTITGTLNGGRNGGSETPGGGGTAILITGYGATNTTISGNTLGPNSGHGIFQEANDGDSTGTDVHQNTISGNTLGGILNNDTASIDASQNWWGSADGPSGAGTGTGDSVSTNVFFDPWLQCPPAQQPCANQPPQASFTASPSQTPGSLQVSVDGTASTDPDGTIASYSWDFGDDSALASGATATHTYRAPGTYTITLTVTDNNEASGTTTRQVTVPAAGQPPQASASATPSSTPGSLQVAFDASSSTDPDGTIVSYAWDFGDGSTATGPTPSHTYAAPGTYTVALTVTDNNGATNTTTHQVTVPAVPASQPKANQPPHASFVLTPPGTAGSLQITVDGSGSSDPDGTIASYAWNFGDGTSATGASTTHTYAAAGTFTVTLTVTDNQGATSSASQQVTVPVPGAPAPPLPPPVKGVSVDVLPFTGTVLVNGLPLVAGQQIPFGATVDTTNGTVLIETISPTGSLDAAYFAGAVFKLVKTPAGLTELLLQGGNFNVCNVKSKRHSASAAAKPPKKKKTTVVRSLWGNGHGQFVTQGKYAAATVRGTIWNTQDRCDGTFVQVQRGVVSVLDLVRHKTKSVTAGNSLLVPAP